MIMMRSWQAMMMPAIVVVLLVSPGCQTPSDEPEPEASLQWNTFMGGIDFDYGSHIAVDCSGNTVVVGTSFSSWGSPVQPFVGGRDDIFVAKFDASGVLQWNTFLDFGASSMVNGVAVDDHGNIYLIESNFVAKLDTNGALQWHVPILAHYAESIAVDNQANIYVMGYYDGCRDGCTDIWIETSVWKFNANGVGEVISTWSSAWMEVDDITVDSNGNIYLMGVFDGSNFAAKLDPDGSEQWKTLLGPWGKSSESAITVDNSGNIYVAGTSSSNWGSPLNSFSGKRDAFVAKLNAEGVLQWNTFLGGSGNDWGTGIAVDGNGDLYIGGSSASNWGNPLRVFSDDQDVFVVKLNANGDLKWNMFLGGSSTDIGNEICINSSGNIYVAGTSYANWGDPLSSHNGGADAFMAKVTVSSEDH